MPIQATFTADVSSLRRNLETASTAITGLKRTSTQVNADLRRFGNDFSGVTLIRRAETMAKAIKDIGGAAVLSDANLKRVNATVSEAIAQYGRLGQTAPAAMRALHGEVAQLVKAQQALTAAPTGIQGGALGSLLGKGAAIGAGAGLAVGGLQAVGAGIRQIAEEGARLSALGRAFEQLQGGSVRAADSIEVARKATRGLVADADLMQAANKATLLGLDAMGIDFSELADVATKLGRAMGMDATKSVDDLTTALSRQSPQILDNLGLKVDLTAAHEAYAAANKKTVDALTEEEKKLAFAAAAMDAAREKSQQLGDVSLNTADNITRVTTSLSDMAAGLAAALNESSLLTSITGSLADTLDNTRKLAADAAREEALFAENQRDATGSTTNYVTALEALLLVRIKLARALRENYFEGDLRRNPGLLGDTLDGLGVPVPGGPFNRLDAASRKYHVDAMSGDAQQERIAQEKKVQEALAREREAAHRKAIDAAKKHQAEIDALTGKDVIANAMKVASQLAEIENAGARIPEAGVATLVKQLRDAETVAKQTGQTLDREITQRLQRLMTSDAYRIQSKTPLSMTGLAPAITGGAAGQAVGGLLAGASHYDFGGMPLSLVPQLRDGSTEIAKIRSQTALWKLDMSGVLQSFSQLAQVAGGLEGTVSAIGSVIGGMQVGSSIMAGLQVQQRDKFGNLRFDAQGNPIMGNSRIGTAAAVGMSALTTGLQLGSLTDHRGAAALMGGVGGGVSAGMTAGAAWGSKAGWYGAAIGAGIGALGGLYSAQKNKQAQYAAKDAGMAQILAQYDGSLDTLLKTVTDLGLNGQKFLQGWYGDAKAFTAQTQLLTSALAKEEAQVKSLAKSFEGVSAAQGVLSRDQIAQIVGTRQGGPGQDAVLEFVNAQRGAAESGLQRAIDALLRRASLTDAEIEALTKDIRDEKDRERKIEEALKAKAGETLQTFGLGIQAAGAGLMAAFSAAVEAGESALSVLRRMQPSIDALKTIYDRAGVQPGAGFGQLSLYQDIASGASGDALEVASGLGQALAGFQNSALLSPELFQELANGIGQAYGEMERLGKGGLDAARLMQPALQAIWQLAQDDPGLLDMLDDQTRALLDFATQSGLVGDKFRPAIDRMVDALDRLITKFDEYLQRLGAASNATLPAPQVGVGDSSNANGGEYGETPGFDGGTGGLRNFGRESLVRLHGREAVLTEGQYHALNAAARLNLSHTPVSAGMPIRIESTTILNGRKVGLSVQEVTPTLHRMYGAAA